MDFLSTHEELKVRFLELCKQYQKYYWTVAWAGDSDSFEIGKKLDQNEKKIEQLIVGLHFYQTHPNFIKKYSCNENVRFIKITDGTFHPKLYLFYNSNEDWSLLIGSSNFTKSGFERNSEANLLLNSQDCKNQDESSCIIHKVFLYISNQWKDAKQFSEKEISEYEKCWKKQQQLKASLCSSYIDKKKHEFSTKTLDLITWDKYKNAIIANPSYAKRKQLLSEAQEIFNKQNFGDLGDKERLKLAGCFPFKEGDSIDWNYFGSTKSNGAFYKLIIDNNENISNAIDKIPLKGIIAETTYKDYIEEFLKSMPNAKNPLALATRLLAIKRPDVFICIDGRNKQSLCKQLGIHLNALNVNTYWELIISRIMKCAWYNIEDSELYPYRVAMLDCLHYKEED